MAAKDSNRAAELAQWRDWKRRNPTFPLSVHASGRWYVRIKGKNHYFGPLAEKDQALDLWIFEKDYLLAGTTPPTDQGTSLEKLAAEFLAAKAALVASGDLTERSLIDYRATCKNITETLGGGLGLETLTPADFARLRAALAATRGPVALGNEINRVRVVFRWAYSSGLTDRPVRWGPDFKRPPAASVRRARHARGEKYFQPDQLRDLIDSAGPTMQAMIYLGINCAYNNADCGRLPLEAARDAVASGWLDLPRGKTYIARRAPLWPETADALAAALLWRPRPRTEAARPLALLTNTGRPWIKPESTENPVAQAFRKLAQKAGHHRPGLGFGALRHTFATVAGATLDQPAVDYIMGHADHSMAAAYRERIEDDRLRRVADHVRAWLLGE